MPRGVQPSLTHKRSIAGSRSDACRAVVDNVSWSATVSPFAAATLPRAPEVSRARIRGDAITELCSIRFGLASIMPPASQKSGLGEAGRWVEYDAPYAVHIQWSSR